MCRPVSRQSRFSLIFFLQQEPEPEPEPEPRERRRFRFRFFLGQNDKVPAVPVPAPVPQHCMYRKIPNLGYFFTVLWIRNYYNNFFFFSDPDPNLTLISDPDSNPDPACL
jgi:hypothetical protein